MANYLSNVADFNLAHVHLALQMGVTAVEYRRDLWHHKARVSGLSCGVVCVILRLAILVDLRFVTERQTERQTNTGP